VTTQTKLRIGGYNIYRKVGIDLKMCLGFLSFFLFDSLFLDFDGCQKFCTNGVP